MKRFSLPTYEEIALLRMRNAFRSAEAVSGMLAATILWPMVLVIGTFAVFTTRAALDQRFDVFARGVIISLISALVGLAVWRGSTAFFYSSGWAAAATSLVLYWRLQSVFAESLVRMLKAAARGAPEMKYTLAVAFSLAAAFFCFWHGVRLVFLDSGERLIIARSRIRRPLTNRLAGGRARVQSARTVSRNDLAHWALLTLALMIQGLSAYLSFFVFGALLLMGVAAIFSAVELIKTGRLGSLSDAKENRLLVMYATTFYAVALSVIFILSQLAMALKRGARRLSRYTFEQLVASDTRPPVLFLRSFEDDQVTLPRPPLHVRYWLAEPVPRRFDHALVERFSDLGPIVAIGKPGETALPFGAARLYVPDEEWQATVERLADRARAVVIVASDSRGIAWEVERMLEPRFAHKTLFLASPTGNTGLEHHPMLGSLAANDTPLREGYRVLAVYQADSRWRRLSIGKPSADDYIVACHAFFGSVAGVERTAHRRWTDVYG